MPSDCHRGPPTGHPVPACPKTSLTCPDSLVRTHIKASREWIDRATRRWGRRSLATSRHPGPSATLGTAGRRRPSPGAVGRHRAPPGAVGRHRPPPGADICKAVVKRPDSHHFAELGRTDGHPASPATPTAASPQALPRRRPPHQPPPRPSARFPSPPPLPTALMSAYRASQDTRRASASRPADTGRAAADRPALISMRSAMTLYARPGAEGAKVTVNSRYENYMGGQWVPPAQGEYFENPPPATDFDGAISIANDALYGLGADVWSRQQNIAYRAGRAIPAGRAWVKDYQPHPVRATFGGYTSSGIGRENDLMMLDDSQQSKNLLVSYSESALGVV